MEITQILQPHAVFQRVRAASKKKLLADIAARCSEAAGLDQAAVFEALWAREKLGSTGFGYGVAIPHGRIERLERLTGVFMHLETPIDFEAVDEAPVDLVFALVAPAETGADNLKALARVSRLMRNAALCENLRAAQDRAQLYALLTEPSTVQAA